MLKSGKFFNLLKNYSTSNIFLKETSVKKEFPKFQLKLSPKKTALIGATESHEIPIKLTELKKRVNENFKGVEKKN